MRKSLAVDLPLRPSGADTSAKAAESNEINLIAILVLVIWTCCLTVGLIGLSMPYPNPRPPAAPALPAMRAEIIEAEVAVLRLASPDAMPTPAAPMAPPPIPSLGPIPEAPPLTAVAAPSPAIRFPMPVEGPIRVVESPQAVYVRPRVPPRPLAPSVPGPARELAFGRGEGKQPAPEYPRAAIRGGQEGTVRVGLTVDESGRVTDAEIIASSPWPLLNKAALDTVMKRWRFAPGAPRRYEVPIRFELKK